jgi:hypothetical protein
MIRFAPVEVVGDKPLRKIVQSRCGLSASGCEIALDEYRKFLYLRAVTGEILAPSPIVDFIWKTHAARIASRSDGMPESVAWPPTYRAMLGLFAGHSAYARTLERYGEEFVSPPPSKAWPSVKFVRRQLFIKLALLACIPASMGATRIGETWESLALLGVVVFGGCIAWRIATAPWGEQDS